MDLFNAYKEAYSERCEKCSGTGLLKTGHFCNCEVGLAESLMTVSAEADRLLEEERFAVRPLNDTRRW